MQQKYILCSSSSVNLMIYLVNTSRAFDLWLQGEMFGNVALGDDVENNVVKVEMTHVLYFPFTSC